MNKSEEANSRKEITQDLSARIEKKISNNYDSRSYWAREVSFDYGTNQECRVDYMLFKPVNNTVSGIEHGDFYVYEVKSSVDDYHSGHGLNFIGDYNYLIMSSEIFEAVKEDLPWGVGVLCPSGSGRLVSVRSARRKNRVYSCAEMLLMMFRSARRDALKGE